MAASRGGPDHARVLCADEAGPRLQRAGGGDGETEARYDAAARGFVLHTSGDAAQKYWIGGAATTARGAVVFAQLYMPGDGASRGVHAFVVRVREDDVAPVAGVLLADCCY